MAFSHICALEDLGDGETLKVESGPVPIALFNVDGAVFATQDMCTHGEWSLTDGYLDGDVIECSLHMARFCVRDGSVMCGPAYVPLKTFPVKIENGAIYVDLEAAVSAA